MAAAEQYRRQAGLLVKVVPFVAAETCFALKGGTAINLFVRDMLRLSVDIDLTYLPVRDRTNSLTGIDAAMRRIGGRISTGIRGAQVSLVELQAERWVTRLMIRADGVQVKVEVTPVLRGCAYEPVMMAVSERTEEAFGFAEIQVVSFADLYAGKIVAALDRQHPRDLFDVRELLVKEGITSQLRIAFVVYLLSHNRPMAEEIAPTRLDIEAEYRRGFAGMTETPVTLEELLRVREDLVDRVVGEMPGDHRRFLMSFERGEPEWDLLDLPHARDLPAVRWRIEYLAQLGGEKRAKFIERLATVLGGEIRRSG